LRAAVSARRFRPGRRSRSSSASSCSARWRGLLRELPPYAWGVSAVIRIGTCSWADEALSKYFYPKGLPAGERLPWYAQRFDTVEVDSTYYRLPSEQMVERWAERTPE